MGARILPPSCQCAWLGLLGAFALAATAAAQFGSQAASVPPVEQKWVSREYLTGAGAVADEGVDIVYFRDTTVTPEKHWVYATGYVAEASGVTRFATFKYDADAPGPTHVPVTAAYYPALGQGAVGQNRATAMTIDAQGNIYVTGYSQNQGEVPENLDYLTIKYDKNLNIPPLTSWPARWNSIYNKNDKAVDVVMGTQSVGGDAILVTGSSHNGSNDDIVTLRYNGDGTLSTCWTSQGEGVGVRRYDNGGADVAVEMSPPVIVCDANPCCNLDIYVLGTSAGLGKDFVLLNYGGSDGTTAAPFGWVQRYDRGGSRDDLSAGITLAGAIIGITGTTDSGGAAQTDYTLVTYLDTSTGGQLLNAAHRDWGSSADSSVDIQAIGAAGLWITGRVGGGTVFNTGTLKLLVSDLSELCANTYAVALGSDEQGNAAAIPHDGHAYVTGLSTITAGGTQSYATIKVDGGTLTPCALRWQIFFAPGGTSVARAIVLEEPQTSPKRNVFVTGRGWGGSTTGQDFRTIRYKPNVD